MSKFWQTKTLAQMTEKEWESLCDGCGRCCLQKLEDEQSEEVYYTQLVCHLYDMDQCACSDYVNRSKRVARCVKLDANNVEEFHWLPSSCAYRLISEGKDLHQWHPLISGNAQTVLDAGISIKGKVLPEQVSDEDDWEEHIIHWVE